MFVAFLQCAHYCTTCYRYVLQMNVYALSIFTVVATAVIPCCYCWQFAKVFVILNFNTPPQLCASISSPFFWFWFLFLFVFYFSLSLRMFHIYWCRTQLGCTNALNNDKKSIQCNGLWILCKLGRITHCREHIPSSVIFFVYCLHYIMYCIVLYYKFCSIFKQ